MNRLTYLVVVLLCLACQSGSDPNTAGPVETTEAPPEVTSGAPATTAGAPATTAGAPATTAGAPATTARDGGGNASVSAGNFSFAPSSVTIKVGESVTWTLSEGAHTTSSGTAPGLDGLWNEALAADEPFTFTFEEPGTYAYFCRFHPDFMTGTVTVEP